MTLGAFSRQRTDTTSAMTTLAHAAPCVIRVLAVDDESDMRGVYETLFKEFIQALPMAGSAGRRGLAAWRLETCASGQAAIAKVRDALAANDPYAVIFMDIRLTPGPDGIETAASIRLLDPFVHIVVATGHSDYTLSEIAQRVPPRERITYVEKPLRAQDIQSCAQTMALKWLEERRHAASVPLGGEALDEQLLYHNEVLVELSHSSALATGGLEAAWREITKAAATSLGADRVAIWLINDSRTAFRCVCRYDAASGEHSEGGLLNLEAHPGYFDALCRKRVLAAHDVAASAEFTSFGPACAERPALGATLDAAIRVRGQVIGAVCHEQTQPPRVWNLLDLQFAGSMADFVALTLEAYDSWRADRILRSSQDRYRELVENARDIIFSCDLDGRLIAINQAAAKITGHAHEALEQMCIEDLLVPECRTAWRQELARQQRGEATALLRLELLHQDERRIPVEINAWPMQGLGGIREIQGIARDVTEQVEAAKEKAELEAQLRTSQRLEAIGRLAGGIAHDFNNLLTAILGTSELMLNRLHEEDPHRREITEIHAAGKRAAALTRQLLAFGRKQILQPRRLDLNSVISNLDTMLRRIIGEDIQLDLVLQPHLRLVQADLGQIEQVIVNLVVNARDAMPKGGRLILQSETIDTAEPIGEGDESVPAGRYACLSVIDDGMGMDDETLARMFEPFFTTKGEKGTGLGLSTAYGIVRQSGGVIEVASTPGAGTTFRVYLPHVEGTLPRREPMPESTPAPGTGRILLVEDDAVLCDLTRRVLTGMGYKVVTAANGHEAVRRAHEDTLPFDLLLTDVVMPLMSGDELAAKLAQAGLVGRVLYMSGYTDDHITTEGPRAIPVGFLQKPFTPETLGRRVCALLETSLKG